jgi:thrombospondin-related anonymous protein
MVLKTHLTAKFQVIQLDSPEVPEEPLVPLEPEVPDEPLVPLEPDVPDVPEEPDVPLEPDVPDEPLVPEEPRCSVDLSTTCSAST